MDQNAGVLHQSPRDPKSPLLDRASLRFIVITGTFKALIAGAVLLGLPNLGYGPSATRTVLFLYMTIGQLLFAYPARRVSGSPQTNVALHLAVTLCAGLQLLTVTVPSLRMLLSLEALDSFAFGLVGGAIGVVVKAFFVIFTMYYLFRDGDRIVAALPAFLPLKTDCVTTESCP